MASGKEVPFLLPIQSDGQGQAQSRGPQQILLPITCLLERCGGGGRETWQETWAKKKKTLQGDVKLRRSHMMKDENLWRRKPGSGARAGGGQAASYRSPSRAARASTGPLSSGLLPQASQGCPCPRSSSLCLSGVWLWPHRHPKVGMSASLVNAQVLWLLQDTSPAHKSSLRVVKELLPASARGLHVTRLKKRGEAGKATAQSTLLRFNILSHSSS